MNIDRSIVDRLRCIGLNGDTECIHTDQFDHIFLETKYCTVPAMLLHRTYILTWISTSVLYCTYY